MSRVGKWIFIAVGILIAGGMGWGVFLWFFFGPTNYIPSNIVDFHPTQLQAEADANFFFSVGDELRYSNGINLRAATLLRGHVDNFLVSPDRRRIAVATNGTLRIITADGSAVRQVAPVDSIYKESKPIGRSFFRDAGFQWSRNSQYLYLIKDEYYESKGSQLYSGKGELWRYDVQTGSLQLVLRPFPAFTYFFGSKSGIYFSVPTEAGDLQLRYFDGEAAKNIGDVNAWEVPKQELRSGESPFFSFSARDFNQLFVRGAALEGEQNGKQEKLVIRNKSYLAFTQGNGMKGTFYCSNLYNSVFLPGDRYFLLNVGCGNYTGQLLIDGETGKYEQLPKDTRVYLTLTTEDIPDYRIGCGGIMPN